MPTDPKTLIVSLHDVHPDSLAQIGGADRVSRRLRHRAHQPARRAELPPPRLGDLQKAIPGDRHGLAGAGGTRSSCTAIFTTGRNRRARRRPRFSGRISTPIREAEFLDLPLDSARTRLQRGLDLFASFGWRPGGFVAPAWLMAEGSAGAAGRTRLRLHHAAAGDRSAAEGRGRRRYGRIAVALLQRGARRGGVSPRRREQAPLRAPARRRPHPPSASIRTILNFRC